MPTATTDWTDVNARAREAAGNWQTFDSFIWWEQPDQAEKWAIVYTDNRDSGLLDQSNAAVIAKALKPFRKHVRAEQHSHWACGHVNGYSIRVYDSKGRVTKAFRVWCELQAQLEAYPVLDDEDYSRREHEAGCENLKQVLQHLVSKLDEEIDVTDDLVISVWENLPDADRENRDDQGACPSDEGVIQTLWDKGLIGDAHRYVRQIDGDRRTFLHPCDLDAVAEWIERKLDGERPTYAGCDELFPDALAAVGVKI